MHDSVELAGVRLRVCVTDGWPHTDLVYHLQDAESQRQVTICGRIRSAYPRPADDDPRKMCRGCRGALDRLLENNGLPVGHTHDDPAWRGIRQQLQSYEQQFVRPRPAWVRTEGGVVLHGEGRHGPWRSLVREGTQPDDPEFTVHSSHCADLVVADASDLFRVSVRWIVPAEGQPVSRYWVNLYVRPPEAPEDAWYESTPRHDPIAVAVTESVAGVRDD